MDGGERDRWEGGERGAGGRENVEGGGWVRKGGEGRGHREVKGKELKCLIKCCCYTCFCHCQKVIGRRCVRVARCKWCFFNHRSSCIYGHLWPASEALLRASELRRHTRRHDGCRWPGLSDVIVVQARLSSAATLIRVDQHAATPNWAAVGHRREREREGERESMMGGRG